MPNLLMLVSLILATFLNVMQAKEKQSEALITNFDECIAQTKAYLNLDVMKALKSRLIGHSTGNDQK